MQLLGATQNALIKYFTESGKSATPPQTILLCGPSGVGKTSLANYYASVLNCEFYCGCGACEMCTSPFSITRMNCGDENGIEKIRTLIRNLAFKPLNPLRYSVYILDEIHNLTSNSQNALLTPLERLPPHVVIIVCTTNVSTLLKPLVSRFEKYELESPAQEEQLQFVQDKLSACNLDEVGLSQVSRIIVNKAEGNIRELVTLVNSYQKLGVVAGVDTEQIANFKNFASLIYRNDFNAAVSTVMTMTDYSSAIYSCRAYLSAIIGKDPNKLKLLSHKLIVLSKYANMRGLTKYDLITMLGEMVSDN